MARRAAVLAVVLLLAPLATVDAQTAPAAPAVPGAPTTTATVPNVSMPGNPSNPRDVTNNPHPTMPWFGMPTPYGQFVRWVLVPPRQADAGGRLVQQPGFWVAETTAGYYYPDHWAFAQGPTGELVWRMVPRAFQPR